MESWSFPPSSWSRTSDDHPIVGSTTRQHPQDDDHLVLVVEAEAYAPIANP